MKVQLEYGRTTKVLHWTVVALLVTQYLIGWLMPNIRRNMSPGVAMTWHVSIGSVILALIVVRFAWRLTHADRAKRVTALVHLRDGVHGC